MLSPADLAPPTAPDEVGRAQGPSWGPRQDQEQCRGHLHHSARIRHRGEMGLLAMGRTRPLRPISALCFQLFIFSQALACIFLLLSFLGTAGALHGGFVKHSSPPGDSANSCCGSPTISPFPPSFKLLHFLVSKAWPAVQIKSWHR